MIVLGSGIGISGLGVKVLMSMKAVLLASAVPPSTLPRESLSPVTRLFVGMPASAKAAPMLKLAKVRAFSGQSGGLTQFNNSAEDSQRLRCDPRKCPASN
jgi:hypothetical protein